MYTIRVQAFIEVIKLGFGPKRKETQCRNRVPRTAFSSEPPQRAAAFGGNRSGRGAGPPGAGVGQHQDRRAPGARRLHHAAHAVANTQYGKVRGYLDGGVLTFKGIPYGQTTGGENRWLPAKPPTPWKDEYPALVYGANCPQNLHDWTASEQTFLQEWDDGWQSEDMLKLNIWTPSLTGKRAVMFYIHGGGYSFGSSYELPSHEGAQMARHHDVVQVSVNHRLNMLGFLDVSEIGGAAYEDSVNVGMTDLVAALKWVRENIANFGGDPDRVMIYGQSGGGSKVTTLMGMPSAVGLFHRAAAQSGGGGNSQPANRPGSSPASDHEGTGPGAERYRRAAEDGVVKPVARQRRRRQDQPRRAGHPSDPSPRVPPSRLVSHARWKQHHHAVLLRTPPLRSRRTCPC